MDGKRVIILAGGIGSGKSHVSSYIREKTAATVIDTDRVAKELMAPGQPGFERTVNLFGPRTVAADGTLDRGYLADCIYRDEAARRALNAAIHPAVRSEVARLIDAADTAVVIVETALAFEAGLDSLGDELWAVDVDEATRIRRLKTHRGMDTERAVAIMAAQMDSADLAARADVVIRNDDGTAFQAAVDAALGRREDDSEDTEFNQRQQR
ncbi:MAG: dephospho-CoA kinase [Eubacteriales bacterium]|nr:dephospho-CoA kinase [Eubacteriales bacterium]